MKKYELKQRLINENDACDYFYNWLTNTLKRMNLI